MIEKLLSRLFYIGLDLDTVDDYPFIMVASINRRKCMFELGEINSDGDFKINESLFNNIRKTIE